MKQQLKSSQKERRWGQGHGCQHLTTHNTSREGSSDELVQALHAVVGIMIADHMPSPVVSWIASASSTELKRRTAATDRWPKESVSHRKLCLGSHRPRHQTMAPKTQQRGAVLTIALENAFNLIDRSCVLREVRRVAQFSMVL